eukprot:6582-Heterococcus_DN1.PRE.2
MTPQCRLLLQQAVWRSVNICAKKAVTGVHSQYGLQLLGSTQMYCAGCKSRAVGMAPTLDFSCLTGLYSVVRKGQTGAGITACHMLSVWSTAHDSNGNDESYKRSYMLVQVRLVCSSTTVSSTQAVLVVARGVVSA